MFENYKKLIKLGNHIGKDVSEEVVSFFSLLSFVCNPGGQEATLSPLCMISLTLVGEKGCEFVEASSLARLDFKLYVEEQNQNNVLEIQKIHPTFRVVAWGVGRVDDAQLRDYLFSLL